MPCSSICLLLLVGKILQMGKYFLIVLLNSIIGMADILWFEQAIWTDFAIFLFIRLTII